MGEEHSSNLYKNSKDELITEKAKKQQQAQMLQEQMILNEKRKKTEKQREMP
eukprot:CAMPEP_0116949662 /NCGR_PEP_ID=MMETSP0467-20121206/39015_1 /TAXON_ID=283647 /ORGANISM="Mesodinium pulex, Strain SPMC105" /LENGTH=51 /DNA_ID=CAMNT_0004634275 /DNA_START=107 /DNA_END=262 /DNA_ORIENTATION=+